MKTRTFMILLAVVSILSLSSVNQLHAQQKNNDGPALMSIHLINVPSAKEQEMAHIMTEFNKLFSILGFPEVKYQLWRVSGNQSGAYTHVWNSVWPNQDAYDKVHQNDDYKNLVEKHRQHVEVFISKETYNRYVQVEDLQNK
jgi:hypothetical protein